MDSLYVLRRCIKITESPLGMEPNSSDIKKVFYKCKCTKWASQFTEVSVFLCACTVFTQRSWGAGSVSVHVCRPQKKWSQSITEAKAETPRFLEYSKLGVLTSKAAENCPTLRGQLIFCSHSVHTQPSLCAHHESGSPQPFHSVSNGG